MKKQNLDIQFFKFFYSCIIVLYHLAAWTTISCKGGYYGVEYFLLTAGLFLFLSFQRGEERGKNQTPGQYLWKRFIRFLPWSTTAFILTVVVERVFVNPVESLRTWANLFPSDIFEDFAFGLAFHNITPSVNMGLLFFYYTIIYLF